MKATQAEQTAGLGTAERGLLGAQTRHFRWLILPYFGSRRVVPAGIG
jgi:hypothetical protein